VVGADAGLAQLPSKDGSGGRQSGGSTGCNENAQLAPSDQESLIENADGRMAAVADSAEEKNHVPRRNNKIHLTPTGLLMEGHFTTLRLLFARQAKGFRQLPKKPSPKEGFDEGLKSERLTTVRGVG